MAKKNYNRDDDYDDDYHYGNSGNYRGGNSSGSYYGNSYGKSYGNGGGYYGNGGYKRDNYYGGGNYYNNSYYKQWNWGGFGFLESEDDNENDIYIKSHESYFTPKDSEISRQITYKSDTVKNRNMIKEFARFFYHKMIQEKDYFQEKFKDESRLTEDEMNTLQTKKATYEELWDKFIPGVTPLEQAINLFKELQGKNQDKELTPESVREKVEKEDGIEFHEELYSDPEINELLEMQELAKKNKFEIFKMLSMIKNLGSEFKIEKEIEDKIVANSNLTTKKIMRDYSHLHMVDLYQRALPNYIPKLLTKDLIVTVPIERTEHKQKIIILLDYSGSMCDDRKQKWVLSILIDRLKYAMKEEAEIFFSYFVHDPKKLNFTHIYDRKSALAFWSKFSTHPSGGDTALGEMVMKIKDEISQGRLMNLDINLIEDKPEILAINDGQLA